MAVVNITNVEPCCSSCRLEWRKRSFKILPTPSNRLERCVICHRRSTVYRIERTTISIVSIKHRKEVWGAAWHL